MAVRMISWDDGGTASLVEQAANRHRAAKWAK
jgi:hypothetical protein